MDRFGKAAPRIVRSVVGDIKPSSPGRSFSTTDTRFSDKHKPDKWRNRTSRLDEGSYSNKPRSGLVRDETSSSKKGVEEVDLRQQVAEALEGLPAMVVEGVVSLQKQYPHFKEAFQSSLGRDGRVSQEGKEANGYQSREAKRINEVKERLYRYGVGLYDHFTDKDRRIKARDVVERPYSRAEEKALLKKSGFEGNITVIAYSEDCAGHYFNCHGLTVADGYVGCVNSEDFQKYLDDNCDEIGTSDGLDKVQAQKDDILVYRKRREEIVSRCNEMRKTHALNDSAIENLVNKYVGKGGDILHSSYVSKEKSGKIDKTISSWGVYGVFEHEPTVVAKEFGSYYKIYRPRSGRLMRRAARPSMSLSHFP